MRTGLLTVFGLAWLMAGGTCLPLYENKHQAIPGEVLGISVGASSLGDTIPEGTPVDVTWSAANLTDEPAVVTIVLESRTDLSRTNLAEGVTFEGTGSGPRHVTWYTDGFGGPYVIFAYIETATLVRRDRSRGLVTIDARPEFDFIEPAGEVVARPSPDQPLTIAWLARDEGATASIGLDPDTNHESGNEIFLLEDRELPTKLGEDSFDWDGTDANGAQVPAGIYNLFARITDNVNDVVTVAGLGPITVAE